MAQKTAMKNNLIALLDQTYPGANDFFDSPARSDGSQKWVDFVHAYWHVDFDLILINAVIFIVYTAKLSL